jgi:hypothetical protein
MEDVMDGYVPRTVTGNARKILVEKMKESDNLEDLGSDGSTALK